MESDLAVGDIHKISITPTQQRRQRLSGRYGGVGSAGHVDLDELDRWVRTGWERRRGSTVPYAGPTS
jgi:hypothetical protein